MHRPPAPLLAGLLVLAACTGQDGAVSVDEAPTSASTSPTTTDATAAATTDAPSSTSPRSSTTTVPGTTAAALAPPKIDWADCGQGGLQCGTLIVPLDYDDPAGGTFALNVKRRVAREADQRIGSLLVNPGGPGVAGTILAEQASFYFTDQLLDRFDLVAWDPRGTGTSMPLDCLDDLDPVLVAADPTPDDAAELQRLRDAAAAFVAGCQARSGQILPYLSTQASARDMDRIRQALGEDIVSYFGFSYGSELGATWVTLFPSTVRAAVFDGSLNPNVGWEADLAMQLTGLERGFRNAMQSCAGDAGCPFNSDGDPVAAYEALAARLETTPLVVDPSRPPINEGLLFYATASSLYDSSQWSELFKALDDARDGNGERLYDLYDSYVERRSDGTFSNTLEAFMAISCLDDPGPRDPAQFAALDARLRRSAPHMSVGSGYNFTCASWPARSPTQLELTGEGAGPILVVGTTGDPITPIESSRGMASELDEGELLTVTGLRHTGYGINTCSLEAVDTYLIELELPAAGTICE